MENKDSTDGSRLSDQRHTLEDRERELAEKTEELLAKKEELTAAIEELVIKNQSLELALNQLKERNFELDQVLYRTSHDLRAPLTSIKGILNLTSAEPQSDVLRVYHEHIDRNTNRMDNLLRSLADLSKAILEKPILQWVDFQTIVSQTIATLSVFPSGQNVEVESKIERSKLYSDPELMRIIVNAIISNAFIFRDTQRKGFVRVISFTTPKNLVIEVTDSGEGIPKAIQPFIFEMFYRGSERSQGNGLGLYVAKKAVEQLKGTIEAEVKKNETRFIVTLPLLATFP